MAQVIETRDPTAASLEDVCEALSVWGFEPQEEQSLSHAANCLTRLGNNATFLGDLLVDRLVGCDVAEGVAPDTGPANHIVLAAPLKGNFALLAVLWPSREEAQLRASDPRAYGYGLACDTHCDVLALGHLGPGPELEDFAYDRGAVMGWRGEPVALEALGRARLEPGRLVHYRAGRDVVRPHPPEALSVSLILAHRHPSHAWGDHYEFDVEAGRIGRVLGGGPSEAFLRIAVALGGEEARDLAQRFGCHHPSERMRIAAWRALAGRAGDEAGRDAVWREAENTGNRVVAAVARTYRKQ